MTDIQDNSDVEHIHTDSIKITNMITNETKVIPIQFGMYNPKKLKIVNYNCKKYTKDEFKFKDSDFEAEWLDLCYNKIEDFDQIDGFNKFHKIQILAISANPATSLPNFTTFTSIKTLYCNEHKLTSIKGIELLINLEKVDFSQGNLTDLSGFEQLSKLKYVDLGCNDITDITPLAGLTNIREISLQQNKIVNIDPIKDMIHLIAVDFSNNPINIQKINPQYIPDSVQVLYLETSYQCVNWTFDRLVKYKQMNPNCEIINNFIQYKDVIDDNTNIDPSIVLHEFREDDQQLQLHAFYNDININQETDIFSRRLRYFKQLKQ